MLINVQCQNASFNVTATCIRMLLLLLLLLLLLIADGVLCIASQLVSQGRLLLTTAGVSGGSIEE